MVEKLNLEGKNSSLLIERESDSWFKCFLITADNRIFLGAETKKYIIRQLLNCFEAVSQNSSGVIDGYPVSWILTLSETHIVLYCAKDKNTFLLFWQDSRERNFGKVGTVEIDETLSEKWINELKAFEESS
jgi:hypothetical protein